MTFNKIKPVICFFIIAFCFNSAFAENVPALEKILIKSEGGKENLFYVEIAQTSEERETGLMFRKKMEQNHGMLFIFPEPEVIDMWMKNTYIPLDILFIDKDGVIKKIAKNATPESLNTISSDISLVAALEINANITDKLSIKVGDKVIYKYFNNTN